MILSRRHFFFGSFALPAFPAAKPAGEQPNILLILVDGLPSWVLGCYGNKEVYTPNIDRLAQTGTRFANHIAGAPVSGTNRATLLTGRTSMQLRDADSAPPSELTLDKLLSGLGYACHTTTGAAEAAKVLDAQAAGKPFLLTAGFTEFHAPYDGVARKYLDRYAQARFQTFAQEPAARNAARDREMFSDILGSLRKVAAAATALDDEVAALLSRLSQKKLMDGTLIVFTSTCGSLLGRHGLWGSGLASDPVNMFEEVLATPMVWSWPGRVPAQAVRPEVVSAYDLVPTVCDIVATALPERNLCGRSYLLMATGKPLPKKQPWRGTVFANYQNTGMAREDRYKIVLRSDGKGPNELYDLRTDARERVNQYDNLQFLTVKNTLSPEFARWKQRYSV
jgi:arylsulfatase A-like enzyme